MDKKCEFCGKIFQTIRSTSKYCSRECRNNKLNSKIKCKCEYCGKFFYRKPSDIKNKKHIFCSRECHYNNSYEDVTCLSCGKIFKARKSTHRKFCSIDCRQVYIPYNQQTNREIIFCKNCGKEFEGVKSAERIYCSSKCFEEYQKNKNDYKKIKKINYNKGRNNFYSNKYLWNPNIKILEEYTSMRTSVLCECIQHNQLFQMLPVDIIKGQSSCTECWCSVGENIIASYLSLNNIIYERQKTFKDCKYINPLHFDFYIPEKNIVIEYDGEQHFFPRTFGRMTEQEAKDSFEKTIVRDEIKNKYCHDNNIKMVRIPYYCKKEISKILDKEIICI